MRCKLQNPGTFLGCFQLLGTTNDLQCRRECYLLLASKVERVWHLLDTKFAAAKTSEEEQARSTYTVSIHQDSMQLQVVVCATNSPDVKFFVYSPLMELGLIIINKRKKKNLFQHLLPTWPAPIFEATNGPLNAFNATIYFKL